MNNPKEFETKTISQNDSQTSKRDILTITIVAAIVAALFIAVGIYFITNPDWINKL